MTRETYRGVPVTVRACKGRDYGKSVATVNGETFGPWGGTPEQLLASVRGTIDAAAADSRADAYGPMWHPRGTRNPETCGNP